MYPIVHASLCSLLNLQCQPRGSGAPVVVNGLQLENRTALPAEVAQSSSRPADFFKGLELVVSHDLYVQSERPSVPSALVNQSGAALGHVL